MSSLTALARILQRILLPGLGLVIILLAVLLSSARLLLPFVEEDVRHALERGAQGFGLSLQAQHIALDWKGLGPRLTLVKASLYAEEGGAPVELERLSLTLDLLRSLLGMRLHFASLEVEGMNLGLSRDETGRWQLQGLAPGLPGEAAEPARPAWMGMASRVHLVGSHLRLHDAKSGLDLAIEDIEALFEAGVSGQRLALRMSLPEQLGGRLELRARLTGSLASLDEQSGELWLSTEGLDMPGWSALLARLSSSQAAPLVAPEELPRFAQGKLGGQVWISLRDGALHDIQAQLELTDWRIDALQALRAGEREVALHSHLALALTHEGEAWGLDLAATPDDGREPTQRFSLRRAGERVDMAARGLDLDLLRPWVAITPILPPDLRRAIILHRPTGRLQELDLHMRLAEGQDILPEMHGHASFAALGWLGRESLPDVSALQGEAWLAGKAALLRLHSPGLGADLHGIFRAPLMFDQAQGELALFWSDTPRLVGRHIRLANPDLELDASLQLDLPSEAAPRIALDGHLMNVRSERIPAYLPLGKLPQGAVEWIERALPQSGGLVPEGRFHVHGDLTRFPDYSQGGGRFELHFTVQDLRLDYAEGWPAAEGVQGELALINNSLAARLDGGHIRDLPLREGWLAIPDFDQPRLQLNLSFQGDLGPMFAILLDTPLLPQDSGLDVMTPRGPANLNVQASVRLTSRDPEPSRAEGTLELAGAQLQAFGQTLEGLKGQIHFVDEALQGQDIRARFRGQEARLNLRTERRPAGPSYRIDMDTRIDPAQWLPKDAPWARRIQGLSPMQAQLALDYAQPGSEVSLALHSDLAGMRIDLPAPLGKAAEERRPTEANLGWSKGHLATLRLRQPERLDGHLLMDDMRIQGGQILLGGAAGQWEQARPGTLRIAGELEAFDLAAWQAIAAEFDQGGGGEGALPERLELALHLGRLRALGQEWAPMEVQGLRDGQGLRLELQGPQLAGTLGIPSAPSEPISLDLAHLVLKAAEGGDASPAPPPDPAAIPPLRAAIARLDWGDIHLNEVALHTLPQPQGMLLQGLSANTGHLLIHGEGSWLVDAQGQHRTRLDLNLSSEDVGAALDELGFRNTLRKGRLEASQLRLAWAAPPDGFDWAILEGEARLQVKDGALESVDPGAGRVLGLLSVTELPRRLMLDFGDVFGEGLRFNDITAELRFQDGRAISELTQLQGPSAQILMKGYSDMLQRTLNYDMVVMPAMGNVLPILGTVAGGPLVGGAVFLLQKVFEQGAGSGGGIQYRISGSWDAPKVERVESGA